MGNNNLPIENTDNFFSKVKRFFINIFTKKNREETVEYKIETVTEVNKEKSIMMDLQEKTNDESVDAKEVLEYTVEIIEKQPEVLNNLTIEKLEKVKDYYDEQISEVDKEIEKIRKKN